MAVKLGLLGWPVGHSLSPKIFASLADKLDCKLSYRAIPVTAEELAGEIEGLQSDGYAGLNVTIPHKQAALALMDALTPEAKAIGAVNTVRFSGGRAKGHNTDAQGFLDALDAAGISPRGWDAVVLGAGGAARAVGYALGTAGARKVRFCARRPEEALKLAREMGRVRRRTEFLGGQAQPAELWVNATPLGMEGFEDLSAAPVLECKTAFDLVYGRRTRFLREAQAAGAKTLDGLSMLVYQALRAWEFWTKPLDEARRKRLAAEILKELR